MFPLIPKRLRLDFGLYNYPNNLEVNKDGFIIYISENGKLMNGTTKKKYYCKGINNNLATIKKTTHNTSL
ncbi:hypothetical protein [Flavobacterium sp. ZB4P13]|uniref:hypothetical protein n=1 Tax=Flavobacterium sp. ZB4P13 TaxID=3401728 RepID=UPI003AAE9619